MYEDATQWSYFVIFIYIYISVYTTVVMAWIYNYFCYMVILRSITGPYGRPMIEVAYGEISSSLYRGCMRDDSSKRVVEVSTCCRPFWIHPGQHQCGLNVYYFLSFYNIKTYMYYIFKSIRTIKRTLVVSNLVLARWGLENIFRPPISF